MIKVILHIDRDSLGNLSSYLDYSFFAFLFVVYFMYFQVKLFDPLLYFNGQIRGSKRRNSEPSIL
ncbi:MAG: hypothetical protein NVS2B12_27770 [Ktedonobacteraceae bacterium]